MVYLETQIELTPTTVRHMDYDAQNGHGDRHHDGQHRGGRCTVAAARSHDKKWTGPGDN